MAKKSIDPRLAKVYPETDQLGKTIRQLMIQNDMSPDAPLTFGGEVLA